MVTLSVPNPVHKTLKRVEILGVFGAGKTTLAKRIAASNSHHLAEDHDANPYWGLQKALQVTGYLPYDLNFLTQHAFLAATAPDDGISVCDWSFSTDRLWASMRLEKTELSAYDAAHEAIMSRLGPPFLYLYLRQPPEVIRCRLASRARQSEESFREHVNTAYVRLEELIAVLPVGLLRIVDDEFDPQDLQASRVGLRSSP